MSEKRDTSTLSVKLPTQAKNQWAELIKQTTKQYGYKSQAEVFNKFFDIISSHSEKELILPPKTDDLYQNILNSLTNIRNLTNALMSEYTEYIATAQKDLTDENTELRKRVRQLENELAEVKRESAGKDIKITELKEKVSDLEGRLQESALVSELLNELKERLESQDDKKQNDSVPEGTDNGN